MQGLTSLWGQDRPIGFDSWASAFAPISEVEAINKIGATRPIASIRGNARIHRMGGAYMIPPAVQFSLIPRGIPNADFTPTFRS